MSTIYIKSLTENVCIFTQTFEEAFIKARSLVLSPYEPCKIYEQISRSTMANVGVDDTLLVKIYRGHFLPSHFSYTMNHACPIISWDELVNYKSIHQHTKWIAYIKLRKAKLKKSSGFALAL